MRSRDGNRTFIHRFYFIIFFCSLALNASEYLVSYRYVVKNATLYNEKLDISNSMQKCHGKELKPLYLEVKKEKNLKQIIQNNYENFVDYIHKLGLHIDHNDHTINLEHHSTTILTLRTTCFKVDFNDNLARITPLK